MFGCIFGANSAKVVPLVFQVPNALKAAYSALLNADVGDSDGLIKIAKKLLGSGFEINALIHQGSSGEEMRLLDFAILKKY
jgi:hypothetical protein